MLNLSTYSHLDNIRIQHEVSFGDSSLVNISLGPTLTLDSTGPIFDEPVVFLGKWVNCPAFNVRFGFRVLDGVLEMGQRFTPTNNKSVKCCPPLLPLESFLVRDLFC